MNLRKKMREASDKAMENFHAEMPDAKTVFNETELRTIRSFYELGFSDGYSGAIEEMRKKLDGETEESPVPSLPLDETESTKNRE